MSRPSFTAILGAAIAALSIPPASFGQQGDQRLGTVHFETSCNETAQRRFDRGMRYQHSFWYAQSKEIFDEVLKADPECAIAYWGIALSLLYNPHSPPPAPNLPLGLAAIQKGKQVGAKTQRERDYIDALAAMYVDYDKVPHGQRVQAYLKAMEALAARYPEDDEAQIAYAITLNVAASPSDKTYANQLKGAALLEPIFRRQPRHPGVAHYLIHLYDTPALAAKGLEAARRYAEIAPAAPHAQHMPGLGIGKNRSPRTSSRRAQPRPARISTSSSEISSEGGSLSSGRFSMLASKWQRSRSLRILAGNQAEAGLASVASIGIARAILATDGFPAFALADRPDVDPHHGLLSQRTT